MVKRFVDLSIALEDGEGFDPAHPQHGGQCGGNGCLELGPAASLYRQGVRGDPGYLSNLGGPLCGDRKGLLSA